MSAAARNRFVPVLLPESGDIQVKWPYYSRMLEAFSEALMRGNCFMRMVPCLHSYQREHFLNTLGEQYAGAVFLGPTYQMKNFIAAVVARLEGPSVMLDHHFDDLPLSSVREDAVAGMSEVAGHLLALGHRHIAYLDSANPDDNPWKREGINRALGAAGLPELTGRVAGSRYNFIDVAAALEWFTGLEPRPTAVIACSDPMALFLLRAAGEVGISVPDDLSIAGFGDFAALTGRSQALTSAGVDPADAGRKAAELILGAPQEPVAVLLPPRLAVRETTAPPPEASAPGTSRL
jgi:DNA-binding LacI/PurR family transcriptional regulator